jgi:hypothetical protein
MDFSLELQREGAPEECFANLDHQDCAAFVASSTAILGLTLLTASQHHGRMAFANATNTAP